MTRSVAPRSAWRPVATALAAVSMAVMSLVVVAVVSSGTPRVLLTPDVVTGLVAPAIGLVIARRQHRNAVGWVFLAMGCFSAAFCAGTLVSIFAGEVDHAAVTVAVWVGTWAWCPPYVAAFTLVPVLFPDGRPHRRSARVLAWVSGT